MFQLSAIIDGVKTLKNNTLKISIETQDISSFLPEELSALFKMNDKQVWVGIKETPIKVEDIKEIEPEFKNKKSPSQRLRNCIFRLFEAEGSKGDFNGYYIAKMEKLISFIKDKIN